MRGLVRTTESILQTVSGFAPTRRILLKLARARQRGIVLLYHRVSNEESPESELVPTIGTETFRVHLQTLLEICDIVPLSDLLERGASLDRVRVAITFDDDHSDHVEHALPLLQALGVPATFFLSGRSLHGLGPYWFDVLQKALNRYGLIAVAQKLGIKTETAADLAASCEPLDVARRVQSTFEHLNPEVSLSRADIETLSNAGMEIGFHTLHHPLLTAEADSALKEHFVVGRSELEAVTNNPIRFFAYPFGKANRHVATRARKAGFEAAFTNRGLPINSKQNRFLLGRLDPRHWSTEKFIRALVLRLNLPMWNVHD